MLFRVVPGCCFGFSLSFFFLAVFGSTKFPHRVKKKQPPENLGGRWIRWPGVFPLKGSNRQYKHLNGAARRVPKKSTIQCSSSLAAMHIWSSFFFFSGEVLHPKHIGKMVGARGGPQQNPGGLCAGEVCVDC